MKIHASAALGPAGRLALVEAIECVAPATAHRWWHRWQSADAERRSSRRWLLDRSSRPHRQPRRLGAAEEEPILRARAQTNLGPGRLARICRRARSPIWKVLWRHPPGGRRLHASAPQGHVIHVHDPLAWWPGHSQPVRLDEILAVADAGDHDVAIVLCTLVGVGLDVVGEELPQKQQEGLETIVGLVAVATITFSCSSAAMRSAWASGRKPAT